MTKNTASPRVIELLVEFAPPLASVILMIFGSAFYTTFLSLYLHDTGYTSNQIGYIQSAYFLGVLIGGFQMEKIIDRIGHIQSLAVFGSLATFSTLSQALVQNFFSWCLFRFCVGVSLAALYVVIESWMLYRTEAKTRGLVLSLYMVSLYASQSVSQQLLTYIDIHSSSPYIISGIFTSLSVIPVGLSRFRVEKSHDHPPLSFAQLIKSSPFGFSGCLIAGLLLSCVYTFYPLYSASINVPSQYSMSIIIAGGVVLQIPIGRLSDYYERRKVLFFTVLACFLLVFTGTFFNMFSVNTVMLITFFMGGFLFTLYPLCITQVCDHVDHVHVTRATALLLVAYGFGSVLGPIISSEVIEIMTIDGLFYYLTLLLAVLIVIGLYSIVKRPVVPLDDQGDFVPVPSTTAMITELDPRAETD